jgi:hypothetical protein
MINQKRVAIERKKIKPGRDILSAVIANELEKLEEYTERSLQLNCDLDLQLNVF